jgi:hypothetical protein
MKKLADANANNAKVDSTEMSGQTASVVTDTHLGIEPQRSRNRV